MPLKIQPFLEPDTFDTTSPASNPIRTIQTEANMSDKQFNQLLERVAKLEAEVERLKSGVGGANSCGEGLLGIFGSQKDNPFFLDVIAEIEAARSVEKDAMCAEPVKQRARRRVATPKK